MSSHPYGLRGDPFASPATLSAKDASRLIRRRVRAFNGDGGTLFPIATCDLIHEVAGGIPDAMLDLAGRAMHIAAAAGAPAVTPAHVRQAAGSAGGEAATDAPEAARPAATTRDDADDGGDGDAGGEPDAMTEADDVVRTRAEIPTRAEIAARAQAALAWEESPAIADDDPDLPAFHPAAFALPNQPSEKLDPDARDWVSRFIVPSAGVAHRPDESSWPTQTAGARPAAGARKGRPRAAATTTTRTPAPAPVGDDDAVERALAVAYGHAAPRRASHPRPRRRRHSGSQGLLIGIAALCAVAFIVRMSLRGSLLPPGSEPPRPVETSARPAEPQSSAPESPPTGSPRRAAAEREPAPPTSAPAADAIRDEPLIGGRSTAQRLSPSLPLAAPTTPAESVAPVRHEAPAGRFGLEVATFIFEERARVERDRLVQNGLRARLVTTVEYGSRVYRVVVGGFPHPAAAERAADSLLSNGVVLQARVIRNP